MRMIKKIRVVQEKPNTCVVVTLDDGESFVGFAKSYAPDSFSPELGMQIALGKAVAEAYSVQPPRKGSTVRSFGVNSCKTQYQLIPAKAETKCFFCGLLGRRR
jgi:hypothetical protein